jgi:hypothetical protein
MNRILRITATLPFLGLLGASLSPANAAQLQVDGNAPYLCAAVQGAKIANGTAVIAYSCSGAPDDQWNYVEGQFQGIGTTNGVSTCLDVKDSGTTAGTLVDLSACTGAQNQQWIIENGAVLGHATSTLIIGAQSGLCLDSSGGPTVGGGPQLVINACTGATSQNWNVREMQIQLDANAPYVCVAVSGANAAQGTPVVAYSCSGGPEDLWNFSAGEFWGIGTESGKYKCLTSTGTAAGSVVVLDKCTGRGTQEWSVENHGLEAPSANIIISRGAGLCLDSSGGPPIDGGTQLVINPCTGAASQNWNVR